MNECASARRVDAFERPMAMTSRATSMSVAFAFAFATTTTRRRRRTTTGTGALFARDARTRAERSDARDGGRRDASGRGRSRGGGRGGARDGDRERGRRETRTRDAGGDGHHPSVVGGPGAEKRGAKRNEWVTDDERRRGTRWTRGERWARTRWTRGERRARGKRTREDTERWETTPGADAGLRARKVISGDGGGGGRGPGGRSAVEDFASGWIGGDWDELYARGER